MAYSTDTPPVMLIDRIGGGMAVFGYSSADAIATVIGAGYITNGESLGMAVGDLVHVYDTATPMMYTCYVSAVSTTATLAVASAVAYSAS